MKEREIEREREKSERKKLSANASKFSFSPLKNYLVRTCGRGLCFSNRLKGTGKGYNWMNNGPSTKFINA